MTTRKYTHLELDREVPAGISSFYTPLTESRLKYHNREVLYVTGEAVIEASCCCGGTCSPNSWRYSIVPGYLLHWQNETNEAGLPVSEVEPITDESARADIIQIIKDSEDHPRIEFW